MATTTPPELRARRPIRVVPDLRERVWGGTRLTPPGSPAIGEAWMVGPWNALADGPGTLGDLAVQLGPDLVGSDAPAGRDFPLLVKLLDPAAWLSVQVHPDDEQAVRLEGPGFVGKTEGWYVIETPPQAAILLGARPSASPAELRAGLRAGRVAGLLQSYTVHAGDAYLVLAGTLHAVGPGPLIYEIQQASDITYRCDDWGRPATAGRALHTEKSLAVARLEPWPGAVASSTGQARSGLLMACRHFVLEYLRPGWPGALERATGGSSAHVLTAVRGHAKLRGDGWQELLAPLESLVVPAAAGPYSVTAEDPPETGDADEPLVLVARLPSREEAEGMPGAA